MRSAWWRVCNSLYCSSLQPATGKTFCKKAKQRKENSTGNQSLKFYGMIPEAERVKWIQKPLINVVFQIDQFSVIQLHEVCFTSSTIFYSHFFVVVDLIVPCSPNYPNTNTPNHSHSQRIRIFRPLKPSNWSKCVSLTFWNVMLVPNQRHILYKSSWNLDTKDEILLH